MRKNNHNFPQKGGGVSPSGKFCLLLPLPLAFVKSSFMQRNGLPWRSRQQIQLSVNSIPNIFMGILLLQISWALCFVYLSILFVFRVETKKVGCSVFLWGGRVRFLKSILFLDTPPEGGCPSLCLSSSSGFPPKKVKIGASNTFRNKPN